MYFTRVIRTLIPPYSCTSVLSYLPTLVPSYLLLPRRVCLKVTTNMHQQQVVCKEILNLLIPNIYMGNKNPRLSTYYTGGHLRSARIGRPSCHACFLVIIYTPTLNQKNVLLQGGHKTLPVGQYIHGGFS